MRHQNPFFALGVVSLLIACSSSFSQDYNSNGFVDAADYTVWQDILGALSLPNRDVSNSGPVGIVDFNSWKFDFVVPALSPSNPTPGPMLSVTNLGPSGGNLLWSVAIAPDIAIFTDLFDEPDRGVGGSVAMEVGFEVTEGSLVSVTKNVGNFPADNYGDSPFTFGDPTDDGLTVQVDQFFAALGSIYFTTGGQKQVLLVETLGTGPTKIAWGGVYGPAGDQGRLAQAGENYLTGGMVMWVPEPATATLTLLAVLGLWFIARRRP